MTNSRNPFNQQWSRVKTNQTQKAEKARKREYIPILFGLIVSFTTALTLSMLTWRHWSGPLRMAELIRRNPTEVGIAVQVISHVLGLILVSALCIALNLTARLQLASQSLTLDSLKLFNALCGNRIDWSMKHVYLGYTLIFVGLNMIPAALWAGAITPAITNHLQTYHLALPDYSDSFGINRTAWDNSSYTVTEPLGTFTFCPQFDLPGFILSNARDAISPSGLISSHAKLDKSGYSYTTRSFGVGSSVGLTDAFPKPAVAYQYRETGLKASTNCIYNESSQFQLEKLDTSGTGLSFNIYNSRGSLPNNESVLFAAMAMSDQLAFSLGAGYRNWTSYAALAVYPVNGSFSINKYGSLHNIQCQIFFDPYEFLVSVNTTARSIYVAPQHATESFLNDDLLALFTVARLSGLASMIVTTQWTSLLGDTFTANVANVANFNGTSNATTLSGVGSAIESMCDDILEALSAAQIKVLNMTRSAPVEVQSVSFVLGNPMYTYGVLGVNTFVALVFVVELIRTRMWRDAPRFDFSDIKAVILNASVPGNGIAARARLVSGSHSLSHDPALGRIRIGFRKTADGNTRLSSADANLTPEAQRDPSTMSLSDEKYELTPTRAPVGTEYDAYFRTTADGTLSGPADTMSRPLTPNEAPLSRTSDQMYDLSQQQYTPVAEYQSYLPEPEQNRLLQAGTRPRPDWTLRPPEYSD